MSRATLRLGLLVLLSSGMLIACDRSRTPVDIGFVGGLSGRVADLGIAGRNGTQLAIEEANAGGGINGRPLRLIIEDDAQDAETAKKAVLRLIAQNVAGIIGPMTSSMAVSVVPLVNQTDIVMISPTATSDSLTNKDDQFFRVLSPSSTYAQENATFTYEALDLRRVAIIYDVSNSAYTTSWLNGFKKKFIELGGTVVEEVSFSSGANVHFAFLAEAALLQRPDGVLIISSGLDAALIAQQVRKADPTVHISTSEWAATEKLVELGGKAVEGVVIAQFFDRFITDPNYLEFRERYRHRFANEPGFASIAGYDATRALIDALRRRPVDTRPLKPLLLSQAIYPGVQAPFKFNHFGDASRPTYITRIEQGQFRRVSPQ